MLQKKKEPVEIQYTEKDSGNVMAGESHMTASSKKASTLSKRSIAKWSKKKVTYPQDIHFDDKTFHM